MQDTILTALADGSFDRACFDAADQALLAYADKLTVAPAAISQDDVQQLRAVGFDDRAIHDACAIVAYFAFVNRLADELGRRSRKPLTRSSGLRSPFVGSIERSSTPSR